MNVPHAQIARVFPSIFCFVLLTEPFPLHVVGVLLPVFSSPPLDVAGLSLLSEVNPASELGGFRASSYALQRCCWCCLLLKPSALVGILMPGNSDYSAPRWVPIVPVWILGTE